MSIIRAPRPERGYFVLRNDVARDSRLSYRARGVLVSILSRPDGWRTSSEQLARDGKEGRDAIRAVLRELQAAGYVQRVRNQDERGRWSTSWMVHDTPQDGESSQVSDISAGDTEDGFPVVGFPGVGKPVVGSPVVGFPGAIEKTETEDRDKEPAWRTEEDPVAGDSVVSPTRRPATSPPEDRPPRSAQPQPRQTAPPGPLPELPPPTCPRHAAGNPGDEPCRACRDARTNHDRAKAARVDILAKRDHDALTAQMREAQRTAHRPPKGFLRQHMARPGATRGNPSITR